MNTSELFTQLEALIQGGDEPKARAFLVDHLAEFPEEAREKIMFAFFTEALGQEAAAAGLKKSGSDALNLLLDAKEELTKIKQA
jgi:hypothetical protein